jgi:hypothetical protein
MLAAVRLELKLRLMQAQPLVPPEQGEVWPAREQACARAPVAQADPADLRAGRTLQ